MFLKDWHPAYVEILENRIVLSAENVLTQTLAMLPGTNFDDVSTRFDLTQGQSSFAEVGIFTFDANGTVGGQAPNSPGFEEAVLNSPTRQVLFAPGVSTGNTVILPLIGGSQVGVYIQQNPATAPGEGRFLVQMTGANTLRIGFDETPPLWSAVSIGPGSDARRFDDASIRVTFGSPVQAPIPTLNPIANRTIPEQQTLQLTAVGQNPGGSNANLRYQLDQAPAGMAIDPLSGLLTWTPTEAQGPGRFDVIVRVFNVNRPQSFATQRFTVDVTEVNSAPVIGAIPDQTVFPGQRVNFVVSATDSDLPTGPGTQLTFSLVNNTVANATIDPVTGRFDWIPSAADAGQTFEFTVRVVDAGNPALDDTETFTVHVNPFL